MPVHRHRVLCWPLVAVAFAPLATAQLNQEQRPTILTRGQPTAAAVEQRHTTIRPYAQAQYIVERGLTPFATTIDDRLPQFNTSGFGANYGATLIKPARRRTSVLDYQGRYTAFRTAAGFSGFDHLFGGSHTEQLGRTVQVTGGLSAGSFQRGLGLFSFDPAGALGANTGLVPTNELFNTRTSFVAPSVSVAWQPTRRWSVGTQATGFVVRRDAPGLAGSQGYMTTGDVSYQLSRDRVVGGDYTYQKFEATGAFGTADIHSIAGQYTQALGRRWVIAGRAGMYRIESFRPERVTLPPEIAAILGTTSGVELAYSKEWRVLGNVTLSGNFRDSSSVTFQYLRGTNPGTGVIVNTEIQGVSAAYSRTEFRRLVVGSILNYQTQKALTISNFNYKNYTAMATASYPITTFLHFTSQYSIGRVSYAETFRRTLSRFSVGVGFGPPPTRVPFL